MVEIKPENHGVVAHLNNIFSTPQTIDEQVMQLHEDIHDLVEYIEEELKPVRNRLEYAENRMEERVERKDKNSIHDLDDSFRSWLEVKNALQTWNVLREGIPNWDDEYEAKDVELAQFEEDAYERSEELLSYKAGLMDFRQQLLEVADYVESLIKALKDQQHERLFAEKLRDKLNGHLEKLVNLEQAVLSIEDKSLERSKELAKKIIDNHDVLRNPSFNDAEVFRYYVLDGEDDFDLLSYWNFHDEIERMTLQPRKKTRYRPHTDSTLPIQHVNLYVSQEYGDDLLIHIIPSAKQEAWEELKDA